MKNIYQRLNAVMKEVTYVQKDKKVSGGGGGTYNAVTHDQVVSVARESLVKNGIVIVPKQSSGEIIVPKDVEKNQKMLLYRGTYNILFCNIDDPSDFIAASVEAHAADNGDKAPGKALTYATKMAILKVLCLETGDDEESRAEARAVVTEAQAETLKLRLQETGSDVKKFLQAVGADTVDTIPAKSYSVANDLLKRKEAKQKEAKDAAA